METKKSIYSEIRCNSLNPEGYWNVDAWTTSDDNEEGKVIAAIDSETAKVFYVDGFARHDSYAQEVIRSKVREIMEPKEDDRAEAIVDSVQV
jgi:hypothetical protein